MSASSWSRLAALLACCTWGPCLVAASLAKFRTHEVKTSFDASKAEGFWYEVAFKDVAQTGASCQMLTKTLDSSAGEISERFSVKYGAFPFAQTYTYEGDPSGAKGVYVKYLDGAKVLLQLPTVVVDVVDGADGKYSLMIEFTQKHGLVTLTELRFLSRTLSLNSDAIQKMKDVAAYVGIERSIVDGVEIVSHTGCPAPSVSLNSFDDALILPPPPGKPSVQAAWIVVPGAEIDKSKYKPLAEAVQKEASIALWVVVLGTYLTPTPIPPEIGPRIDYVLNAMKDQGLDLSASKLFYGGHSLGSVFIQDHLNSYHGTTGPLGGKIEVLGQVLMGGFLQRKYNWPAKTYPVSTLTIGGELDGLARCTRLAEAFHAADGHSDFPVVIVPGMTHMQFASGDPPLLVKARDLQPEVSYDEAHSAVAKIVASYFGKLVGASGAEDASTLSQAVGATSEFVKPIIAAYELEGARYFNAPAQYGGPLESACIKGGCDGESPWAPKAQEVISAVEGWRLDVSNQYVDVSSTPLTGGEFHLPKISNDSAAKTITITTYSQNYWDDAQPSWFGWKEIFDSFDTGFVMTSAEEIATKLASRQCTLIQGVGEADTPFSVDDPQFCAITNRHAYLWAQKNAGSSTAARFRKYGQKYTFDDDIAKSGGPFFIKSHLQFNELTDAGGESVISVAAPMQKTEIDYWKEHFGPLPRPPAIPDPGCFHYCKLLSPARATEWIYVDSLRLKRSLSSLVDEPQVALHI